MIKLAVIDPGADDLAGKISEALRACGGGPEVGICRFDTVSAMHGFCPDVLVLSPAAASDGKSAEGRTACGIALLPGDAAGPTASAAATSAAGIDAGCVVTYGMSPKNTITLSSISETVCVLALQRELLTAAGDVLERQEIKVAGGMKPDMLLAVMGTLLICGARLPGQNT
jgi:hypothetical protein